MRIDAQSQKRRAVIACALIVFGVGLMRLTAQTTTTTISGTVTDASGAFVAGAKVEVKNVGTGITRSTTSDSQGRFRAPELSIGRYEVQVAQGGGSPNPNAGQITNASPSRQLQLALKVIF